MRKLTLKMVAACVALAAASFSNLAGAQSIAISPVNSTVNTGGGATTPAGIAVVFNAGGTPPVTGYQTDIDFNNLQMTVALSIGNATSCVLFDANTVRILDFDAGGAALPTGTACTLTFTVNAGQTGGTVYPVNVNGTACSDSGGNPVTCTETDGTITVVSTSSPTVTFAPTPAAGITFPAGTSGTTANSNVTIDGTGGTSGQSTSVGGCSVTGTGLSLVSVTPNPTVIASGDPAGDVDGTIVVQCSYAAGSPRTGTLQCTVTPTVGSPTTPVWNITCPAGGATPPTITYAPPVPGPIVFSGAAGSTATGSVTVTQATTGQAGTSVIVNNCVASAGFTAPTGQPVTINGGTAGQSGTISTTCVIPATTSTTGTLTCNEVTNNGVASTTTPRVFNLTCQAPSPEFNSTPPAGSTITLTGAPSTTVTGSINVQNTGLAALTVTNCGITGTGATSFTVPVAPASIAPGGNGNITFACTAPAAAGTTVTAILTCTTNDTDEGTVTYNLACTSLILSIPTVGLAGKGLMILLVLSLGLIGFGVHRRMA